MQEKNDLIKPSRHTLSAGGAMDARRRYGHRVVHVANNPATLHSLGIAAYQSGNFHKALNLVIKAIDGNRLIAQFHNTLGVIFEALGKYDEAVGAYRHAILLKPFYIEAYGNMAIAFQSEGKYCEAVDKCRQLLRLSPDHTVAYNTMGYSLKKLEKFDDAIDCFNKVIELNGDFAEAYNHLGEIFNIEERYSEAIGKLQKAIELSDDYAEAYNNLGVALKAELRFDEAIDCYKRAIGLDGGFSEAYYNYANLLRDIGDCDEAIANFRNAIKLSPDNPSANWNLSLALLLNGEYDEGWELYPWRESDELDIISYPQDIDAPCWDGSGFAGKRLFIHYEQGYGDNMQFARYLPMVKRLGGTIVYEAREPLYELFKQFESIDELVEAPGDGSMADVEFDFHTSLLELPRLFKTTVETIPADVPYIRADAGKAASWKNELLTDKLKVGLAWAGDSRHGNDHNRSCALKNFAGLGRVEGVKFFGLQKGDAARQAEGLSGEFQVTNLGESFSDFGDTAAVIENLDVVISVDTSVLHLAGAMGKKAWALIAFAPEWRWLREREDSPWYPTMRLYRQKKWGDWEGVFERIADELSAMVGKKS